MVLPKATWQDRLRKGGLPMRSPSGHSFSAQWRGSPRSAEKKLGQFDYPGIVGTVAQDLGLRSISWPLTFWFKGPDHDIEADKLMKAVREPGLWTMTHPVYGFLGLQLVRITEEVQPVISGNVRRFESDWMEPIDPLTLKTAAELSNQLGLDINALASSSLDEFADGLSFLDALSQLSISEALGDVSAAIDKALGPLTRASAAVGKEMLAIQRGIQDTLASAILNPIALAGQIQALVETPLKAFNDIKSRLNAYADLAGLLVGVGPETEGAGASTSQTPQGKNKALIQQISMNSCISANAQIAQTAQVNSEGGGLLTQREAVVVAVQVSDQQEAMVVAMDASMGVFEDVDLTIQHHTQTQSGMDAVNVTTKAVELLYKASYNLRQERRYILKEISVPIKIALLEYDGPGENDANIEFFMDTNKLKGQERLILYPGREISIYA